MVKSYFYENQGIIREVKDGSWIVNLEKLKESGINLNFKKIEIFNWGKISEFKEEASINLEKLDLGQQEEY